MKTLFSVISILQQQSGILKYYVHQVFLVLIAEPVCLRAEVSNFLSTLCILILDENLGCTLYARSRYTPMIALVQADDMLHSVISLRNPQPSETLDYNMGYLEVSCTTRHSQLSFHYYVF